MDRFLKKRPGDSTVQPPPAKKAKPVTKYSSSYEKEFPFLKASHKGETFAFCSLCVVDISISSGGRNAIKKHVDGLKHQNSVKECSQRSNTPKMTGFFPKDDDWSVIRAEVFWTQFIIDKNLPLNISDDFGNILKKMCPDSEIAKKFGCGRTKTGAIAGCLGSATTSELVAKMRTFPFSMGTDGSSDTRSKLYPVVITINDEVNKKIYTELLSIPTLKDASTAENITDLLLKELDAHKIPISNCVGFMSDNASVMVGKENGVSTKLKEKNPNMVNLGCGCHLINLAVKKGLKSLPIDVDEVLTDVYYFFHRSDLKNLEFDKVQLLYSDETKQLLKHCPTRWLSITPTLQRLVELWQPLFHFLKSFKKQEEDKAKKKEELRKKKKKTADQVSAGIMDSIFQHPNTSSALPSDQSKCSEEKLPPNRLDRLLSVLKSKKALIYCSFVLWIMPTFDKYNKCLQKEEPQIYKLKDLYLALYKDLLCKFVQPRVISAKSACLTSLDYENEAHHVQNLFIGKVAMGLIADLKTKSKLEVHAQIKQFYCACLAYIKKKFDIHSDVLQHAEFLNLSKRESCTINDPLFFMQKMPVFEITIDQLHEEFSYYQTMELPGDVLSELSCDKQWNMLMQFKCPFDDSRPLQNLAKVALSVLSIPHSNAAAERIFSLVRKNRTESRSLMSNDTLNTLLVNKVRMASAKSQTQSKAAKSSSITEENPRALQLTDVLLKKCKKATMESLQQQKSQ